MMTVRDASIWASDLLGKNVTPSNISYLIQYGLVPRAGNGTLMVKKNDLERYYQHHVETKENLWREKLGDDLNWQLSFSQYKESETTRHVHRLHPYKGKFIPQLVEYFLDRHTDAFKREAFFAAGDVILDPFCGSGTTLVQASELGLHAIGLDVSAFNAFISNAKVGKHDIRRIEQSACDITNRLLEFQQARKNTSFERHLLKELSTFNAKFFPAPDFRARVRHNKIDEKAYGEKYAQRFLEIYTGLLRKYRLPIRQKSNKTFLDKWFLRVIREEIDFVFEQIQATKDTATRELLSLVLSRTIRSCRATTHADLGTLKSPVTTTYYCKKHGKICKPLFSILGRWRQYTRDTLQRLEQFEHLRTDTFQRCLVGDSRTIDIAKALTAEHSGLRKLTGKTRLDGIFSSPPYVGLIDYHEQHAYAYDLFGFDRQDELEIGPLYRGQGLQARESYVQGIASVLKNCKAYLKRDYDVLLVANDKHGLYPEIAARSGMQIVNEYRRPVLNRVEKDRAAYAETIFRMKER